MGVKLVGVDAHINPINVDGAFEKPIEKRLFDAGVGSYEKVDGVILGVYMHTGFCGVR